MTSLRVASPHGREGLGCSDVAHLASARIEGDCGSRSASLGALLVVGANHRTAPLDVRGRLSVSGERAQALLRAILDRGAREAAVLSTCNRTEAYVVGGYAAGVRELLARTAGFDPEEISARLYAREGACAACHLFRVAAGLDSAVLGETEIVAQVKDAWRDATLAGAAGPTIDLLFARALEASKRIRTETDVCRSVTSVGSQAVREADALAEGLAGKRVLLIGAGRIAERVAKELRGFELARLAIVNRTAEKARLLAERFGAEARPWSGLDAELEGAEIVFATISAASPILNGDRLARLARARVLLDLGVPSNVSPGGRPDGLRVVDMDRLVAACAANSERRVAAIPASLDILEQEIERFCQAIRERGAAPTIRALVEQGESIRLRNLEWALERLEHLGDSDRKLVEDLTRRIVRGLLQAPIEGLKSEFAEREHRAVVRRLFQLSEAPE